MCKMSSTLWAMVVLAVATAVPAAHASGGRPASEGLVPPASAASGDGGLALSVQGLAAVQSQLGLRPARERGPQRQEISLPLAGGYTVYGGTRLTPGLDAGRLETYSGLRYPLSAHWTSTLESSFSAGLPASPRSYSLSGRLDRALAGGRGLSFGVQYSASEWEAPGFPAAPGSLLNPLGQGLRHPALTATAAGYELRLSYRYGERNSVGLAYGSLREFDFARYPYGAYPGEGRQYSLTGHHWLTPDWALSYGLVSQESGGPRGQGLRLGLRYSF